MNPMMVNGTPQSITQFASAADEFDTIHVMIESAKIVVMWGE